MVRLELFVPGPGLWCSYKCSRLLFLPTSIVMAYYSKVVVSGRARELVFRMPISKFCLCALTSFVLTALAGCISDFTSVKYIAGQRLLLSLPEVVHNFAKSV